MRLTSHLSRFFPRAAAYASLGRPRERQVRENPVEESAFPYSERHLRCVWFDPAWRPRDLLTADGEAVTVLEPGRWNLEAGPDFLDAVLVLEPGRRTLKGDVEIHIHPSAWKAHGHSGDPRYDRVVAHVTYFPRAAAGAPLPVGAVRIALRDALRANPAFSFDSVDLAAYPYAVLADPPAPCARILCEWTAGERAAFLESAGEERLRRKAARLAAALAEREPDQILYEEILAALGYKQNRLPFRELAARVPVATLREESDGDPLTAFALLLGVAGLLPRKPSAAGDADTRTLVRAIWDRWWKLESRWESRVMPAGSWRLAGQRPPNHPVRRLAAAASLFAPAANPLSRLGDPRLLQQPARWFQEAQAAFEETPKSLEAWRRRYSFTGRPARSDLALVGSGRVSAILSNIVVPFLAATNRDVRALVPRLPPEEENAVVRQTAHRLFGRDHNAALHRTGLRQQGLLQVFHDFCLNNRAGCAECGLEAALKNWPRA